MCRRIPYLRVGNTLAFVFVGDSVNLDDPLLRNQYIMLMLEKLSAELLGVTVTILQANLTVCGHEI